MRRTSLLMAVAVAGVMLVAGGFAVADGDRELTVPEQAGSVGASEWLSRCNTGIKCLEMGEFNNGIGCPSSYTQLIPGCSVMQFSAVKYCIYGCDNDYTGGLCKTSYVTCDDTTNTDSPGICGAATGGHCDYTCTRPDGSCLYSCVIVSQGCIQGGGSPTATQCGVVHTCK